ncbi:MAG: hypothetical protein MJA83_06070, partial [Gammaproteobacteria bacterium]|nr:hypothetical protein [Gammaproteobacteria bacterium]
RQAWRRGQAGLPVVPFIERQSGREGETFDVEMTRDQRRNLSPEQKSRLRDEKLNAGARHRRQIDPTLVDLFDE